MSNDWFRSWHGAPTDNKWLVIARKAGVAPGVVSAVVWALLDYASQCGERGTIAGFDVETYAAFSGFDEAQVQAVIDALKDKEIIDPDGGFKNWKKRQPKREDNSSTERSREFRQRQKENERGETQCNAAQREATLDKSREDTDTEKKEGESAPNGTPPPFTSAEVLPFPKAKGRKADRGTRLPADWQPSSELIDFARNEGFSDAKFERELASFRDYWLAASGPNATKRDWDAAFRNWLRKAANGFGGSRGSSPSGHGSSTGGRFGAMQRALARVAHTDTLPE